MVDEDSHSTDLSVSEEGHSTILLAHYIFWFQLRTKLFRNADYARTKMLRNLSFVVQFANFRIGLSFCNFRYKKQLLKNYGERFGKSRATCGKPY